LWIEVPDAADIPPPAKASIVGFVAPLSTLPGQTAAIGVSAEIALLDASSRITRITRPAALHRCAAVGTSALDRGLVTLRSVLLRLRRKRKG